MRHILMVTAALAMLGVAAAPASAQKYDRDGKCRDDHGRFAKDEICKGAGGPHHMYKLDKKGKCRDEHSHFAKDEFCHR